MLTKIQHKNEKKQVNSSYRIKICKRNRILVVVQSDPYKDATIPLQGYDFFYRV